MFFYVEVFKSSLNNGSKKNKISPTNTAHPTLRQFNQPRNDDQNESKNLGYGADDLKNRTPFHFHAVHKCQEAWFGESAGKQRCKWTVRS